MSKLTARQAQVLHLIKKFIKLNDYSPNINEIAANLEIYPNGARDHVKALETKGAITQVSGKQRTIRPVKGFLVRIK